MRQPLFLHKRPLQSFLILLAFLANNFVPLTVFGSTALTTGAQELPWMPKPGVRVGFSPEFTPAHLSGLVIHPEDALKFDFLIDRGDKFLTEDEKKAEYQKLIKYFLASLTIPDEDQWVNLSPYEKDRIIKDDFGTTEMGRDLLAQDYLLKQITSSLIYPEENLGKKFWDRVYERAWKEFGTTQVPVNTFNKVWIIPDEAAVYESGNTVYVLRNHLKVMLEEDYLSLQKHANTGAQFIAPAKEGSINRNPAKDVNSLGSHIIREIVLPELEKEVNEGKNFALLRQIYSGMILATWYKRTLKESLLGEVYADKAKVKGVNQEDPKVNEVIYQQYLRAFKKGVFNYIKEDIDKYTQQPIPRKYFSGGIVKGYKDALIKRYKNNNLPRDLRPNAAMEPERTDMAQVVIKEQMTSDAAMFTGVRKLVQALVLAAALCSSGCATIQPIQNLPGTAPIYIYGYEHQSPLMIYLITKKLPERISEIVNSQWSDVAKGSIIIEELKNITGTDGFAQKVSDFDKDIEIFHAAFRKGVRNLGEEASDSILKKHREDMRGLQAVLKDPRVMRFIKADLELNGKNPEDISKYEKMIQDLIKTAIDPELYLDLIGDLNKNQVKLKPLEDEQAFSQNEKSLNEMLKSLQEFESQYKMPGDFIEFMNELMWMVMSNPDQFDRQKIDRYLDKYFSDKPEIRRAAKIVMDHAVKFYKDAANRNLYIAENIYKLGREIAAGKNESEAILAIFGDAHVDPIVKILIQQYGIPEGHIELRHIRNPQQYEEILNELKKDQSMLGKVLKMLAQQPPLFLANPDAAVTGIVGTVDTIPNQDKNGGIDLNSVNLNLRIKRDGAGVPMPLAQQDAASLSRIEGFFPVIIEIKPAVGLPIFSELGAESG